MKKRKMKITLITKDGKKEYNLLGEYDEKTKVLSYLEKEELVAKVSIDLSQKILMRENHDYKLKYSFKIEEETINEIYLKELASSLFLKIKTKKFSVTENRVDISYLLVDSNEEVHYTVSF